MVKPSFALLQATTKQFVRLAGESIAPKAPLTLYHYTSAAGLLGIVGKKELFLSDAFFLNDQSEVAYGRALVLDGLKRRLATSTSGVVAGAMRFAASSLESSGAEFDLLFRFYVASLCENGNQLSQWRTYGNPGSGYAVGFDIALLQDVRNAYDPPKSVNLRRVIYDPTEQVRLVDLAIDECCRTIAHELGEATIADTQTAAAFSALFVMLLAALIPQFKHPVFEEEHEWRLLYGTVGDDVLKKLEFRQAGTNVIPYLKMPLAIRSGTRTGRIPICEITHAPAPEPELKKRFLRELLSAHGYPPDEVRIAGSDIPLRLM